jgi:hypothetical protein
MVCCLSILDSRCGNYLGGNSAGVNTQAASSNQTMKRIAAAVKSRFRMTQHCSPSSASLSAAIRLSYSRWMHNMREVTAPLISLLLMVGSPLASAGEVDRRFEGVWVGVETFQVFANFMQKGEAPVQKSVVIAVGDGGRVMAVAQGFGYGRYEITARSKGNTLEFQRSGSATMDIGRTSGTLVLSPDGNTMKEKGFAFLPGTPNPVMCNITATLRRQNKR